MLVLAAPGLQVPREEKPRDFITENPPEDEAGYTIPESPYYLRRIAEGDLLPVTPPKKSAKGGE